jgi:hypothetical protein
MPKHLDPATGDTDDRARCVQRRQLELVPAALADISFDAFAPTPLLLIPARPATCPPGKTT